MISCLYMIIKKDFNLCFFDEGLTFLLCFRPKKANIILLSDVLSDDRNTGIFSLNFCELKKS